MEMISMVLKAGTILINKDNICLIYRTNHDDYSFPKGHLEEGETLAECAVRETEEETKRKVKLLLKEPIYIEHYTTPGGIECECHYYLGRDDGKSDNSSTDTHDVIWTNINDVENTLTYESLRNLWNSVKNTVEEYIEND